ncbi:hypothetical protein ES703_18827 [subsurface metagenome]
MNKENEIRDEKICEQIDSDEKICITCKHFVENRTPESIAEHGEFSGYCIFDDPLSPHTADETPVMLIVMADSTCDNWISLFR